jgi:DNA/RNA endonuclease YhcR with UshA esterase domain
MRIIVLVLSLFLTEASASAETIQPSDTPKYVGKSVTVEGPVSEVHHAASGKVIFVDMGGHYPNNAFAGVLFSNDALKFPEIDSLEGKIIDISGVIKLNQGRPEIILNDPAQVKAR